MYVKLTLFTIVNVVEFGKLNISRQYFNQPNPS